MEVTTRKMKGNYDGREVPYIELEVIGDRHTLSVRKYPKNISVQMWKNSDKRGTKVTMKIPHGMFDFEPDVLAVIYNFDTEVLDSTLDLLKDRWDSATASESF